MFSFDHIVAIYQLLPPVMRMPRFTNYISAAIRPLIDVYDNFTTLRTTISYDLQFNGQVIYLEHLLNDKFDDVARSIYITDAADIEYFYVYSDAEATDQFIYTDAEIFNGAYVDTDQEQISLNQFIINIPNTGINQNELKALVNKYKLAGKNYIINIF